MYIHMYYNIHSNHKYILIYVYIYTLRIRDNKDKCIACTKELRATVEMSVVSASLGVSMVMAGNGDTDVLRVLRELRRKLDDSLFGSQMMIAMCIGE